MSSFVCSITFVSSSSAPLQLQSYRSFPSAEAVSRFSWSMDHQSWPHLLLFFWQNHDLIFILTSAFAENLDPTFTPLVFTHSLKREVRSRKVCSLHGIVMPPIGWSYPNSSSAWLNKSRKRGSFKYDGSSQHRLQSILLGSLRSLKQIEI